MEKGEEGNEEMRRGPKRGRWRRSDRATMIFFLVNGSALSARSFGV